jgi:hypothetical protein
MADIDNLKIQQDINKLIDARRAQLSAISKEMNDQLKTAINFATAIGDIKADEMLDRLKESEKIFEEISKKSKTFGDEAQTALGGVAKAAQKTGQAHNGISDALKNLTDKYPSLGSIGSSVFKGLTTGANNLFAIVKTLGGVIQTAITYIGRLGFAILSAPFWAFSKFVEMASQFVGDTSFLEAIENVRKQFGNLKEDISKDVIGSFKNLRGELANTGLSVFRVLGLPAERLKYMTELFEGIGPQAHQFGVEMMKNAESLVAFTKGLGIAEKDLKGLADRASAFGTTMIEQQRLIANYSLQMGKAFGMSQKVIARDMNEMIKDVKHFGSLSQKEMATTTIFTRKLGIEVKNLTGLIDKFDTFEDAANSASQLNQAFGASIDAFKMMEAETPAKRLDMLRQAMFAAGKSADNMSRQELKLAAQTVSMDEAVVQSALSSKNLGVSYDKIESAAEKAEKAQLSQTQATKQLADSIERMIKQGNMLKGTFFDTFVHGFALGIKNSRPWLNAIMAIRTALWETLHAGREVGMMFVNTFPGIKDTLDGIANLFRGNKFKSLLGTITGSFREFFAQMKSGNYSPSKLIENMRTGFFNFLNPNTPEGNKIINGVKDFLKAYVGMFANFAKWGIEAITKGINQIADFIRSPKAFMDALKKGAGPMKGTALAIIQPLLDALIDKTLWINLGDALWKLLSAGYERLKDVFQSPKFQSIWGVVWKSALAVMFGPIAVRGVVSGFIQMMSLVFGGGGGAAGVGGLASSLSGVVSKFAGAKSTFAGIGAMLLGMGAMAIGILALKKVFEGMKKEDVEILSTGMKSMATVMLELSIALPILTAVGAVMIETGGAAAVAALAGLASLEVLIAAMGANVLALMKVMKSVSFSAEDASKMKFFVEIIGSISEFAKNMAIAIDAARPSFIEIIFGQTTTEKNFHQLNEFVKNLIGDGGIKGIIDKIVSVSGIFSAPEIQNGARVFVDVLQAVSNLVKTMLPIFQDSAVSNFINLNLIRGKEADERYVQLSMFVDRLTNTLTRDDAANPGLIIRIKRMVLELSSLNITEIGLRGIDAFSKLTGSIGSIMQGIIPSLEVMSKLGISLKAGAGGIEAGITEVTADTIAKLGDIFKTIIGSLGPFMDTLVSGTFSNLISKSNSLKPDELNKLSKVIPLFGTIGQLVQSLGVAGLKAKSEATTVNTDQIKTFVQTTASDIPIIGDLLKQLSKGLNETITSIVSASDKISDPAKLLPRINIMSKAFEMLGAAANSIKSFSNFDANMTGFADKVNKVITPNLDATLTAAVGVVASINALNEKLKEGDLALITADINLRKYAGSPELRDKKNYTITNNGVTINAVINVTMTASDVEDAVLLREKSTIREHLLARAVTPVNAHLKNPTLAIPVNR